MRRKLGIICLSAFLIFAAAVIVSNGRSEAQTIPNQALTAAEIEGILYMREEEKAARDLYTIFNAEWNRPVFQNISSSEQTHMDAIKWLIDKYGLSDPAEGKALGVFANSTLQDLYNRMKAQGSESFVGALRAGALIEETDIADLKARIAATDNPDIKIVYGNLVKGSRNHLRAFFKTLARWGETYQPVNTALDEFDAIAGSGMERGGVCSDPWRLNLAEVKVIEGKVEQLNFGLGLGRSSIFIADPSGKKTEILTGPYFYMLNNGFELKVGDLLKVWAYQSLDLPGLYAAKKIENAATGETLEFRNESGRPLWSGKGNRNGRGRR